MTKNVTLIQLDEEAISAGGIVRSKNNGETFILLAKPEDREKWNLPKGRVDRNETLEETAIREVREETGLYDVELIKKIGQKYRTSTTFKKGKTIHYYLFNRESITKPYENFADFQNQKMKWFSVDDLPPIHWLEQEEIIKENIDIIKE